METETTAAVVYKRKKSKFSPKIRLYRYIVFHLHGFDYSRQSFVFGPTIYVNHCGDINYFIAQMRQLNSQ